ncbi:hypothetical protein AVEN_195262-1, partial [Araneus ventricosus]
MLRVSAAFAQQHRAGLCCFGCATVSGDVRCELFWYLACAAANASSS